MTVILKCAAGKRSSVQSSSAGVRAEHRAMDAGSCRQVCTAVSIARLQKTNPQEWARQSI